MTLAGTSLDPLRPCADGRFVDELVVVEPGVRPGIGVRVFPGGRVHVRHRLQRLDDDLAETLAVALSPITDDHEVFVRAFAGIVLTSHADPLVAWESFYRTTLRRSGGYDDVYRHALELLPQQRILDLGCGFGFLSLELAARGRQVLAADAETGVLGVLDAMSNALGLPVGTCPDTALLPDACVDAVALVHVLEHVADPESLIVEAMRLARARVVVAVPYELTPNPLYGHIRSYDSDVLSALAPTSGWEVEVHEHHGGWLVLDRRG